MKRSKIFLFLTTGCLAVAGLFAAKTDHLPKQLDAISLMAAKLR